MRVLVWMEPFLPQIGGMEIQVAELLTALQAQGHTFTIISGYQPGQPALTEYQGSPLYRFPFTNLLKKHDLHGIAATGRAINEIKEQFQPDLVHVHSGFFEASFFFLLKAWATPPTPTLLTVHGLYYTNVEPQSVLGRVIRQSNWIVGVSDSTIGSVRQLVPEVAERTSRIYNGLPKPSVAPGPLVLDPPRLLTFGRLVPQKGLDLAIAAMPRLRERFPNLTLTLAGDGPSRPDLEAQVQALGLGEAVSFLGWVEPEAIPALINTASIVLMPSRWEEPFGLSALQAAQQGRPVVATRLGGLPEVVADGESGLCFDPESSESLAEAVTILLNQPERAQAMSQAAKQRMERLFPLDRCADAYDTLYQQLVAKEQPSR